MQQITYTVKIEQVVMQGEIKRKKKQKKINVEMVFDHPSKKIKIFCLDTLYANIQYTYDYVLREHFILKEKKIKKI